MEDPAIFHIDPNQLFREGLRRILDRSPFRVDGEARSLAEGLKEISVKAPKIILIDILIVDTDSWADSLSELVHGFNGQSPRPKIVVLTESLSISCLIKALSIGVDGYLLKNMSSDALMQSLSLVLAGEKVFPTELAHHLISNRFVPPPSGSLPEGIRDMSARETEILSLLVNGHSNKAIANQLNITEGTVKVHIKVILKKINASNRTQAAIWALQNGIVGKAVSRDERPTARQNGKDASHPMQGN